MFTTTEYPGVLALLFPYGSLRLTIFRAKVTSWRTMYHYTISLQSNFTFDSSQLAAFEEILVNAIVDMTWAARNQSSILATNRASQIYMNSTVVNHNSYCEYEGIWTSGTYTVTDTLSSPPFSFTTDWSTCSGSYTQSEAQVRANLQYGLVKDNAIALYTAHLAGLTGPINLWPLYDPSFKSSVKNITTSVQAGLIGGAVGSGTWEFIRVPGNYENGSVLNYIQCNGGAQNNVGSVNGILMTFNSENVLTLGLVPGNSPSITLVPGEYVNRLESYSGDWVQQLIFHTSKGQTLTCGSSASAPVYQDLDFSTTLTNSYLCSVLGTGSDNLVWAFQTNWCIPQTVLTIAYPPLA